MKAEELRGQTKDQLTDQLLGLRKEQFNLRFQRASGQLENTARAPGAPRYRPHQNGLDPDAGGRANRSGSGLGPRRTGCQNASCRASW